MLKLLPEIAIYDHYGEERFSLRDEYGRPQGKVSYIVPYNWRDLQKAKVKYWALGFEYKDDIGYEEGIQIALKALYAREKPLDYDPSIPER